MTLPVATVSLKESSANFAVKATLESAALACSSVNPTTLGTTTCGVRPSAHAPAPAATASAITNRNATRPLRDFLRTSGSVGTGLLNTPVLKRSGSLGAAAGLGDDVTGEEVTGEEVIGESVETIKVSWKVGSAMKPPIAAIAGNPRRCRVARTAARKPCASL